MTAPPLNAIRSVPSSRRLSTQPSALAIIVLISFLATSCATLPHATGSHLSISSSLPSAVAGSRYNAAIAVTGGIPPYQFSISDGALPPGLALNEKTGTISGMPIRARKYSFTVSVTDPEGKAGDGTLSLSVAVSNSAATLTISPSTTTIASGETQKFDASIRGTSNTAVQWITTAGKISSSGLFTPPSVTATQIAVVKATSVADPSSEATATVTITPAGHRSLRISPSPLRHPPVPTIDTAVPAIRLILGRAMVPLTCRKGVSIPLCRAHRLPAKRDWCQRVGM